MTTETRTQVDLATCIQSLTGYDKKAVKALADAFVETLSIEDVPFVSVNAAKHAEGAKAVQTACEVRLISGGWTHGREWSDERVGGEAYEFKGAPGDYEILDPDGLHAAFAEAGVPQDRLDRALFKVWKWDNGELNELAKAKPEWAEIIDEHRTRKRRGPLHLVLRE